MNDTPLNEQAVSLLTATRAAFAQLGALGVHYAVSIIGAVLLLIIGWMLANLVHRWALGALSRVRGIDETLSRFFSNMLRYVMMILVFVMVLGQFGVQTTSIVAALGAAGLAIGLALQGTLQNIAAGIMLLVLRPFRVGDDIETPAIRGTVREVGLFATELRTRDGLYLLTPNSLLWNTPVTNYSRCPARRADISIKVADGEDLAAAEARLKVLARAEKDLEQNPAPEIFYSEPGDGFSMLTLRFWVATTRFRDVTRRMNRAVKDAFRLQSQAAE